MKVLIIVDLQNDFCPGGALPVNEGDEIVRLINRLMKEGGYDCIIASKDWHPENHVSFKIWPKHSVENTRGAEFHPDLETRYIDKIILKGQDKEVESYSAFIDNTRQSQTGLLTYLVEKAVSLGKKVNEIRVDICGLALDYCVKQTAIDASLLGLNTRVILDATRAVCPEDDIEVCKNLIHQGVNIIDSRQVILERGQELSLARKRDINLNIHI